MLITLPPMLFRAPAMMRQLRCFFHAHCRHTGCCRVATDIFFDGHSRHRQCRTNAADVITLFAAITLLATFRLAVTVIFAPLRFFMPFCCHAQFRYTICRHYY